MYLPLHIKMEYGVMTYRLVGEMIHRLHQSVGFAIVQCYSKANAKADDKQAGLESYACHFVWNDERDN